MKKIFLSILMLIVALGAVFAAFDPAYSDKLFYQQDGSQEDLAYLEKALSESKGDAEKAEILWRMARDYIDITDDIEESQKQKRLDGYNQAEAYADQSLALKETADGYHWKSSAIGRVGQVNGPLNSLSKAKPMLQLVEKVQNDFQADMSDAWYVLGLLYNQLPGSPISFGNNNYAISYMRRSIDTRDTVNRINLTLFLELSDQLYDRNWKADKRAKEIDKMKKSYDKESVPTEKMKFYEGKDGKNGKPFYSAATLSEMSDREEAVMLLQYAIALYNTKKNPLPSDTEKINEIKARLEEIT